MTAKTALTDKTTAFNAPKMGRPPLGNVKVTVYLPPDVVVAIDGLQGGSHRRAKFIRDAVREKLARSPLVGDGGSTSANDDTG